MKWILWREYRLNRLILITGAVILVLPYLVVLAVLLWPDGPAHPGLVPADMTAREAAQGFIGAAVFSLSASHLIIALLGGNAFAGERADRSAEFVAYLPLPRIRLLWGKLAVAFSTIAIIWGINLCVTSIVLRLVPRIGGPNISMAASQDGLLFLVTGLTFYCVSWLISSLQSNPTFAVLGGLLTPLFVFGGIQTFAWKIKMPSDHVLIGVSYIVICLTLAVAGFALGTWYYLKRVEP